MKRSSAAIAIVFIGSAASFWIFLKQPQTIAISPRSLAAEIKAALTNTGTKDSDGDGLFDWEESVSATNPLKADTDNDGYLDGEEVASGYNPLRQAPDDQEERALSPRPLPKTLIAAVSKRVAGTVTESVAEAISKKGAAGLRNPEEIARLVDGSVPENVARGLTNFLDPVIDPVRFSVAASTSKEARVRYLREVMRITSELDSQSPDPHKTEVAVISDAVQTLDFEKVLVYRDLYQKAEERIGTLTVPVDLVTLHQEILALVRIFGSIHQAVSELESDPLKTVLAIQAYTDTRPRFDRFAELLAKAVQ